MSKAEKTPQKGAQATTRKLTKATAVDANILDVEETKPVKLTRENYQGLTYKNRIGILINFEKDTQTRLIKLMNIEGKTLTRLVNEAVIKHLDELKIK